MEYIIAAVLGTAINIGALTWREKRVRADVATDLDNLGERVEFVEQKLKTMDVEVAQKVMVTLSPVAKAVRELQTTLGV